MAYSPLVVANTILQRAFKEARDDMSPMKLQKLVFFLHGWLLATHGRPSTNEEFQVWQYGPVLPSLYQATKSSGSQNITSYLQEYTPSGYVARVVSTEDADFYSVLDLTWEKYIGLTAIQLSTMTHLQGTPWQVANASGTKRIANEAIQSYFADLARPSNAKRPS